MLLLQSHVRGMRARRVAAEMREWKRIEDERIRLEQLEQERLEREKEAADELSIEESLKYVYISCSILYQGTRALER